MDQAHLLYCPCPDNDCARKLAHLLMDAELIACANILPQIESIYRWQGKVEHDSECVLILKTRAKHVSRITEVLEDEHPYDGPASWIWVLHKPISALSAGYMNSAKPLNQGHCISFKRH